MRVAHKTHKSAHKKRNEQLEGLSAGCLRGFARLRTHQTALSVSAVLHTSVTDRQMPCGHSNAFRPKSSISATTSIGIAGMGEMNFCKLRAFNYI